MSLMILAHGGSWERRFQVSSLAASAVAEEERVTVALFFAALDAWAQGRWDELDPDPPVSSDRLAKLDLPPLSGLLEDGRRRNMLRILACSASVRILGLETRAVQERVDAIAGWSTFHRQLVQSKRVVTL